jgi:hypothetical protein
MAANHPVIYILQASPLESIFCSHTPPVSLGLQISCVQNTPPGGRGVGSKDVAAMFTIRLDEEPTYAIGERRMSQRGPE